MYPLYSRFQRLAKMTLFALAMAATASAQAAPKITLLALFKDKAIFRIDQARRVLASGDTSPEGVKLISADANQAVIELDGRRQVLELALVAGDGAAGGGPSSVTLWADGNGFFHAEGSINGVPVQFLVDTGANTVAMNSALAQRIGIDYQQGKAGITTTASGYVSSYSVFLTTVKIGEIVRHNILATVIQGPQPATPLLGMSFLNGMDMRRDGDKMELIQKY